MIRYLCEKMLDSMHQRYNYDVEYMRDILRADLKAFIKYMTAQMMASHTGKLPPEVVYAAKLRSIIWDDCGPCTQLMTDMALEAGASSKIVSAIINRDLAQLPDDLKVVVEFTDSVLAHSPTADELRDKIIALWGMEGLIAISFSISSSRVYPALKYALGHGKACQKIKVEELNLVPTRA